MSNCKKKINTRLLHDYPVIDQFTGASSIPIYQTSTFNQKKLYDENVVYTYTRFGNPTITALEEGFKSLSNAKYAVSFSSGMAAIANVLMLLKSGEHIILPKEVYGGTCQFVTNILPDYNIEYSFVDMADIANVKNSIKKNTKMIYIETPSNPLLKISDIEKLVKLAKNYNIITAADNTFMTPLYQFPLEAGVDIVIESVTKFINGHSDVLAGYVATNNKILAEKLRLFQKNFGSILGVEDAWLILRGMKTLAIRLERSVKNAQAIAEYLLSHPKIKHVYYPNLKSHKNHDIHIKQALNGGAVLSFEFFNESDMLSFTENIKIPLLAVSLGGVESIISHPATMSHACLSEEERLEQGVTKNLLRLSCGIEDLEDLINDFEEALN